MASNGFFEKMYKEALNELADGKEGTWREVSPNVLIMACMGMLANHLTHRITKPLWFFSSAVAVGVIWLIVRSVIGI